MSILLFLRHAVFRVLPVLLAGGLLLGRWLSCSTSASFSWADLCFSIGIATPFLVVGSLVWYGGTQRRAARFFFAHCATVVLYFACFPTTTPLLRYLALFLATVSVTLLFHFLWFLPQNYLALLREEAPRRYAGWVTAHVIVDVGSAICRMGILPVLLISALRPWLASWLSLSALLDLGVGGSWSLVAYRGTEQPREREQLRLVWLATVLAVVPPLGLLVIPHLLHWPTVPPWLALLSLPLFPLILGYAVFRFQLLLPDRVVSRGALWLVSGLLLPLALVLVVGVAFTFFPARSPSLALFLVVSLAGVGPLLWWGTGVVIPLLFAQDTPALAAFLAAPPPVGSATEALALLSSAFSLASRSRQVYLCLCLDGQRVCVPVSTAHTHLLHRAHAFWGEEWSGEQSFFLLPEAVRLRLHTHGWLSLQQWQASPSLFTASRLLRVFSWGSVVEQEDILALPVSVPSSDHLLGVLLLGPAEDRLPYAGADLERVIQVTDVAAPCLAQIQQREDDQRQDRLLHQLYHGLALLPRSQCLEEMVRAYADLIVACGASVEAVWTNASQGNAWVRAGAGPWLAPEEKRALLATEKGSHVFARLEKATGRAQWHSYPLPLPPRRLFC